MTGYYRRFAAGVAVKDGFYCDVNYCFVRVSYASGLFNTEA